MTNTCSNCISFSKPQTENNVTYGNCNNKFWSIHPDYYSEDSKPKFKNDGVQITYSPKVGIDFGCIHYKEKV